MMHCSDAQCHFLPLHTAIRHNIAAAMQLLNKAKATRDAREALKAELDALHRSCKQV